MNRRTAINSAVIAAAAAATAGIASAADAEIEVFVDHWKKSKDFTLKVAQAMPAENYDYKPFADAARSAASCSISARQKVLSRDARQRARSGCACERHHKGHNHQVPHRGLRLAIGAVGQLTAADLTRMFSPGRGPSMTGLDVLYQAMIHTAHTRGYAEMYLRNKGIVPPEYAV